jgi:hypothetical protein
MRNTFGSSLRFLAVAAVAVAAGTFTAQAAHATTLTVPFAFQVGDKVCPAGNYQVRRDGMSNSIEMVGNARGFKWIIFPGDPAPTDQRVILKFASVGSRHVLRSVQFGSMTTSRLDKKFRELEVAEQSQAAVEIGQ